MKPQLCKILATAALLAVTVVLNAQPVEKRFEKTFKADCNTKLTVSHSFGELKIVPHSAQTIEIVAVAKVEARKAKNSEKLLEKIDIKMDQTGNEVKIKTILDNVNNSKEMEINMEIRLPECIAASLKHRFGNMILPDYKGKLFIDLEFGTLSAGKILHPENVIELSYSESSKITETSSSSIKLRFSGLTITEAAKTDLNSQYSKLQIAMAPAIEGKSQFDKIAIDEAAYVKLNCQYTTLTVGQLIGIGIIDAKFGNINIGNVKEGFKELTFDTEFTDVKLKLEKTTGFTFDARGSFSTIKVPFAVSTEESSNKLKMKADHGKTGSITATLSFGSLRITN
jgi:hypothetical protein